MSLRLSRLFLASVSLAAVLPGSGVAGAAIPESRDGSEWEENLEPALAPPRFETFTVADGLVSNEANVFLQDRRGFLWVGTFGGLSRFDGASFRNFLHDPAVGESLVQNNVNSLCEDRAGNLWVGTNGGLDRFDPETETFLHFRHEADDEGSLGHDVVRAVVEGPRGAIWAGTRGGGLNRVEPSTGGVTRVLRVLHDPAETEDEVHALLANADGTLWVGGSDGLTLYDPVAGVFSRVGRGAGGREQPLPVVYTLARGREGEIWAGTRTEGLFRHDPETGETLHYPSRPKVSGALGNPWVLSMTLDRGGTLWVGTNGAGLHRYDPERDTFARYRYDPSDSQSLRDDNVLALIETRDGVLWAGTYGGLARRYPLSSFVAREGVRSASEAGLRSNAVTAFAEDADGTLWIGTDGAGLHRSPLAAPGELVQVPYDPEQPGARAATDVLSLVVDDEGAVWVGAIGGLYRRDPGTGAFDRFSGTGVEPGEREMVLYDLDAGEGSVLGAAGLGGLLEIETRSGRSARIRIEDPPHLVTAALRDRSGRVWAGTYDGGLWRLAARAGRRPAFEPVPATLGSREVTVLFQDGAGAVWVGTADGLDRLVVDGGEITVTHFHRADGLPNTSIKGLVEDDRGRLWVATAGGLSWRDPRTGAFVSYDTRDGIGPGGTLYRSPRTGRVFVGGNTGFASFDPSALTLEPAPPAPTLTGLRILGRPAPIGAEGSPLGRALAFTDALRLRYDHRVLTFSFASLDFRAPSTHRYAVRLDGFDTEWRDLGGQREATFTGLGPGRYTLRLRAAGRDGSWGEVRAFDFAVAPPPWRTWWAYLGYLVLGSGTLGAVYRNRRRQLQLRHRMEMEQLEAEKLRELDQTRSRFFANVSHELRTPLTLTLGPLADLREGLFGPLPASAAEQVDLARRNASRVLDLVNQILDVARLEAGRTPLRARRLDLGHFVETVALPFRAEAVRKQLAFEVGLPTRPVEVYADPAQLEKAVANLFSNALKFTSEGGRVSVEIVAEEGEAHIEVRDDGPGIPAVDLPRVFDRFYQVDATNRAEIGSGIGLALAKEIADLHGARLSATSEVGSGSTFTLTLVLGTAHLAPEQIDEASPPWRPGPPPSPPVAGDGSGVGAGEDESSATDEDRTTLLVVEDHSEMRAYLRRHLEGDSADYRVLEAVDGEDGLAQARTHLPDLVVSDVMMPKLDGLGLCRALRSDPETDFLPVILLTAKAAPEDKLEGLAEQCDDYLTKPFDPAELRARVANLIASRKRLRERYREEGRTLGPESGLEPVRLSTSLQVPSADEVFLERVRAAIEEHLDDASFSVERLAAAVAMSRGHLHRQLKALTGEPPSGIIRKLRLERAAQLLACRAGTVSEIGYAVGFKSVGHFSDSFARAYGHRPSNHAERLVSAGTETA